MQSVGILITRPRFVIGGKLQKGTIAPLPAVSVKNTSNHMETVSITSNVSNIHPYLLVSPPYVSLTPHQSVVVNESLVVPSRANYSKGYHATVNYTVSQVSYSVGVQQTATLDSSLTSPLVRHCGWSLATNFGIAIFIAIIVFLIVSLYERKRDKKKKD